MKPTLQLRFSQQLTMTPQLQQAIKLLQLSSIELEAQIIEALETNPLLERADELDADGEGEAAREEAPPADDSGGPEPEVEAVEWDGFDDALPDEGRAPSSAGPADGELQAETPEAPETLADHLLWQLHLANLSDRDRRIGAVIIEALAESGYLTATAEELLACFDPALEVDEEELEAVRHRIQRFDPAGVASRTLGECLAVQLDLLAADTPGRALALRIAADHLETLARQDFTRLERDLGADRVLIDEAVALLRRQHPRPGHLVASEAPAYVKPDVVIERQDGRWRVRLNADLRTQLGINSFYAGLIGRANRSDADYLRGQLQEARWLLKSLETRNDTILKVAEAIVRHQASFLELGPVAMKPLVLREIAEAVEMHESTVSRVTRGKYMATPRGVFEFKYFFSSHVGTSDGGECSATAIQAMIRQLVADEAPAKPLSDARIAAILNDRGIGVARRTVAKYREGMNIPASSQRKRLS